MGEPEPKVDYSHLTPSQRIALCWEATKQAWTLTGTELDEPDFVQSLKAFRDEGVEHIVIGAHALAAHGHVQATHDIDLWVKPTHANGDRT